MARKDLGAPVQMRSLVYYHRLYPFSRIGEQLQYRVRVSGRWSQWMDVPEVEAKNSPRLVGVHQLAEYRQAHREKKRAA